MEVLDSISGKTINRLPSVHKTGIREICVSKFGNYFLTIGEDKKTILWDGAQLNAMKKFQVNQKAEFIRFVGFNHNETTVYIVTDVEIVVFKINPEDDSQQLQRTLLKDKVIEGACLLDDQGALITADSQQFISLYDVINLVKVNLTQKMNSVNAIRQFEPNFVWFAYSNNTVGVYKIKNNLIQFNAFEKKVPFEVLEITQLNKELYFLSGFDCRVVLVNSQGHFLQVLHSFENTLLIKKLSFNPLKGLLSAITSSKKIECFKVRLTPKMQILDNLWINTKNVSQIELSIFDQNNIGFYDGHQNNSFFLNGQIVSIGYNQKSYLAVLFQAIGTQKIQLMESSQVMRNIQD